MENTSDYKYDVFISYSRKDYVDENKNVLPHNVISQIKEAFDENNISYWIDEEGNLTGKKFAHIIAGKIRESLVFLFVCSKNSVASKWVDRELAVADEFDKHIIPFICDNSYKDDKVVMFTAALDRIEFFGNFNPIIELEKLVNAISKDKKDLEEKRKKEEEELEKKRQEEEKQKRLKEEAEKKEKTKEEITQLSTEYKLHSLQQETILQQLLEKNALIKNEKKKCPICGKEQSVKASFCDKCGFQFPALFSIDGNETFLFDEQQLKIAKSNYNAIACLEKQITQKENEIRWYCNEIQNLTFDNERLKEQLKEIGEAKEKLIELTKENEQLKKTLEIISRECEKHINTIKEKEAEAKSFQKKHSKLAESESYYKEMANLLEAQKQDLEQKIASLEKELSERKKLCEQSEQKLNQLQKRVQELEGKSSASESQVLYDIILSSTNSSYNIAVVKLIKDLTNLGLKESKDLVDRCPSKILSNINKKKALEIRGLFKAVDAKVVLRQSAAEDADDSHSAQKEQKKITSNKEAQELILQCRIDPYKSVFANDQIIQTIDVVQLKKELEDYGVYMSIYEIKNCKTIEKLKKAILKKSGISTTQQ